MFERAVGEAVGGVVCVLDVSCGWWHVGDDLRVTLSVWADWVERG